MIQMQRVSTWSASTNISIRAWAERQSPLVISVMAIPERLKNITR